MPPDGGREAAAGTARPQRDDATLSDLPACHLFGAAAAPLMPRCVRRSATSLSSDSMGRRRVRVAPGTCYSVSPPPLALPLLCALLSLCCGLLLYRNVLLLTVVQRDARRRRGADLRRRCRRDRRRVGAGEGEGEEEEGAAHHRWSGGRRAKEPTRDSCSDQRAES